MANIRQKPRKHKSIKDAIHNYIDVDPLAQTIIDTPEFQGLRELRQLGVVHYVYPSANHTRFEHSLGVYHLTGLMIDALVKNTPDLVVTSRQRQLIMIGGLTHDLGHLMFSHLFDNYIAPLVSSKFVHHEKRSESMLASMIGIYDIDITPSELDFIKDIIRGRQTPGMPRWMFQIVANSDFHLDVDKCDYIVRDSFHIGLSSPIQIIRILQNVKVINDNICFHHKVYMQLADVFIARYRLHREVYRHHAVIAIELMVVEILKLLSEVFDWKSWFDSSVDYNRWRELSDSFIDTINGVRYDNMDMYKQYKMQNARHLLYRIKTRDLFPIAKHASTTTVEVSDNLGYTSGTSNPLDMIKFYNAAGEVFNLSAEKVSQLLPMHSNERITRLYDKS